MLSFEQKRGLATAVTVDIQGFFVHESVLRFKAMVVDAVTSATTLFLGASLFNFECVGDIQNSTLFIQH